MIDKIYNEVISFLLKDIDAQYIEELKKDYYVYLEEKYTKLGLKEEDLNIYINMEKVYLSTLNSDMKKRFFIIDPNFNEIGNISQKAFNLAKLKKKGELKNIDLEEINQLKSKLKELFPKVRDFNKSVAQQYISEALLDFNYIVEESEFISFGIAHMFR